LIRIATPLSEGQAGVYDVGDQQVEYKYDYMGRRVEQKVSTCTTGGQNPTWQAASYGWLRFIYDGWNIAMVLDGNASNAITRKYTWGLDLSGTIHGAGGIGGLLACEEPQAVGDPKRYWFMYDANGNVGQVLDATDTNNITIAARYEYDPYGNPIPIPQPPGPGPYADLNPIRFSTKWFDRDFGTDLGYWGYRSYSPPLGRWISRDPIAERGGLNLYAFVGNGPINRWDALGQHDGAKKRCIWVDIDFTLQHPVAWGWPFILKGPTPGQLCVQKDNNCYKEEEKLHSVMKNSSKCSVRILTARSQSETPSINELSGYLPKANAPSPDSPKWKRWFAACLNCREEKGFCNGVIIEAIGTGAGGTNAEARDSKVAVMAKYSDECESHYMIDDNSSFAGVNGQAINGVRLVWLTPGDWRTATAGCQE